MINPIPLFSFSCVQYLIPTNASDLLPPHNITDEALRNWCFTTSMSTLYARATAILHTTMNGECVPNYEENENKTYAIIDKFSNLLFELYSNSSNLYCSASFGQLEKCVAPPIAPQVGTASQSEMSPWVYWSLVTSGVALACFGAGVGVTLWRKKSRANAIGYQPVNTADGA